MNLNHLYLTPLEQCNLNCKICYTQKTKAQLTFEELAEFIDRYRQFLASSDLESVLETVTLCGGEIFLLSWITDFINNLTAQNIIVEIITNGTINRLAEINQPNLVNLIVSLDGLPKDHDHNRGQGNFDKSFKFLQTAIQLGFHVEIFSVITGYNFDHIQQFEQYLQDKLGFLPDITYHPRKNKQYLAQHPISNIVGTSTEFAFLTSDQLQKLAKTKTIFPPLNLGCHQLAVMSDGNVYGCCEGMTVLGKMSDDIAKLVKNYQQSIKTPAGFCQHNCQGCSESDFVCGIAQQYVKITAK